MLHRITVHVYIMVVIGGINKIVILLGNNVVGIYAPARQAIVEWIFYKNGVPFITLQVPAILVAQRRGRFPISDNLCRMQAANGPVVAGNDDGTFLLSQALKCLKKPGMLKPGARQRAIRFLVGRNFFQHRGI